MRVSVAQSSHLGDRDSNQDRCLIVQHEDAVLLAVADGMGGHARGDLAAEACVDSLRRQFLARDPLQDPAGFLRQAVHQAHRTILAVGRTQKPPVQPLTTLVCCLVQDDTALWAHAGDSRLYLLREGRIFFQTRDHTPVADLLSSGLIDAREARHHRLRNRVSQCLGNPEAPPEISIGPIAFLEAGDVLLLCSDGLWSALAEERLTGLCDAGQDLAGQLDALVSEAEGNSYPRSDNVSAVALRWEGHAATPAGTDPTPAARHSDPLQRAIADIEQAIADYGGEMEPGGEGKDDT
ncbi:protein phosphatase 2C domain-containing protein [Thiohalobacter sp. IOR34]|uniref:PP2C family protein-serine/threonine phosphatase n=1 Tax=Thiohalobacter sp. IOR34 TaxID=3057176 RepID=UPI0025B272CB|nr:protein phosphatase 2C domain-containing protein [Thiohalobacter sp. IOR34]WJW75714.1 protein phosphatase 2C domain-containing protein [Thiohalobacter sp. IOR34]